MKKLTLFVLFVFCIAICSTALAVSPGDDPSSSDKTQWSGFSKCAYSNTVPNKATNVKTVQDICSVYSTGSHSQVMDYGGVDGVFGQHTKSAVLYVQSYYSLTADGVVGPNTWKALCTQLVVETYNYSSMGTETTFCPDPDDNYYLQLNGDIRHVVASGYNTWAYKSGGSSTWNSIT